MRALQRFRRPTTLLLAAIVVWSAVLRLWVCDSSLPGLQIDEASNAWNAYCLLKTGRDEWGQPWPIFYTRAFDDYRSPLYLYLLVPFQAIGGMNVCTTRLPAAIGGVATVLLVYYIGRQLFEEKVGLIAAAFVALAPWHVQHTRWGHEGTITPLLFAAALAAMLWAGAAPSDRPARPRPWAGLIAGIVAGVACYGYASLRLVIPATGLIVLLAAPRWWICLARDRDGRRTVLAIAVGLTITLGPLAWMHLMDPLINRRAASTLAGGVGATPAQRAIEALRRYPAHFGHRFLFTQGSTHPALASPAGYGGLHWYALPLLLAGAGALVWRARGSCSARVVLVLLIAYPAGDVLFGDNPEPHPLRSFNGIVPLALIASVGASVPWRALAARHLPLARTAAGALGIWVLISHALFARTFFGEFNDDPAKYWQRHVDLMQACALIRPHVDDADAVFVTNELIMHPHVLTLVFLEHDPRRWFAETRTYVRGRAALGEETACAQYGKVRLMHDPRQSLAELSQMSADARRQRAIVIVRPSQRLASPAPVAEVRRGELVWLLVYDLEI